MHTADGTGALRLAVQGADAALPRFIESILAF